MKYQFLFFLKKKNDEKVFINVVCCSRDWRFVLRLEVDSMSLEVLHCPGKQ